jgi:hypothetical protein
VAVTRMSCAINDDGFGSAMADALHAAIIATR